MATFSQENVNSFFVCTFGRIGQSFLNEVLKTGLSFLNPLLINVIA